MRISNLRATLLTAAMLVWSAACSGTNAVPPNAVGVASSPVQRSVLEATLPSPDDTTSILKKLTKDVVIGSTVDPTNGDMGPRALSRAAVNYGLKKGQLLVCNFSDSSGTAGNGTTIEVLDPLPGSKPSTFVQNTKIRGCDGDALSSGNSVYGAGWKSHVVAAFNQTGKYKKTYGPPIEVPFSDADANCGLPYAPEGIYVGDSKTGSIVKFSIGLYGNPKEIPVITGFAVNQGSGWGVLGPSGMQYDARRHGSRCNDTLYIVDGVTNTIVAVKNASNLLVKGEIVVLPGGKTFKCKDKKATCATLVYSGSPLDAPVASAFLPNGNLIVANTKGGNKLVELTPAGQILATKVVDQKKASGIFGLLAVGKTDSDTVLFYTDKNDNKLHELEQ
jgi:hypothetical protein